MFLEGTKYDSRHKPIKCAGPVPWSPAGLDEKAIENESDDSCSI